MNGAVVFRLLAWLLALGLLALPVVGLLSGRFASDRWPLRQLELHAELHRIPAEQIRAIVAEHSRKGFFALSLSELRQTLARLPWVESVEVRKRWPDTVFVRLLEYQPYAVWNDARLVSRSGRLFAVPDIDAIDDLPRLSGPDSEVADVVNFHARAVRLLGATGHHIAQTRLSSRGSWSLVLDDGMEIVLGRQREDERLERFADTVGSLSGNHPDAVLRRADLRYPNGFALIWGEPASPTPQAPQDNTQPVAAVATDGTAHPIFHVRAQGDVAGMHKDTDA